MILSKLRSPSLRLRLPLRFFSAGTESTEALEVLLGMPNAGEGGKGVVLASSSNVLSIKPASEDSPWKVGDMLKAGGGKGVVTALLKNTTEVIRVDEGAEQVEIGEIATLDQHSDLLHIPSFPPLSARLPRSTLMSSGLPPLDVLSPCALGHAVGLVDMEDKFAFLGRYEATRSLISQALERGDHVIHFCQKDLPAPPAASSPPLDGRENYEKVECDPSRPASVYLAGLESLKKTLKMLYAQDKSITLVFENAEMLTGAASSLAKELHAHLPILPHSILSSALQLAGEYDVKKLRKEGVGSSREGGRLYVNTVVSCQLQDTAGHAVPQGADTLLLFDENGLVIPPLLGNSLSSSILSPLETKVFELRRKEIREVEEKKKELRLRKNLKIHVDFWDDEEIQSFQIGLQLLKNMPALPSPSLPSSRAERVVLTQLQISGFFFEKLSAANAKKFQVEFLEDFKSQEGAILLELENLIETRRGGEEIKDSIFRLDRAIARVLGTAQA